MAFGAFRGGVVLAVAVDAVVHVEGALFGDLAHLAHVAVAFGAAHARLDVGGMVELHVIWQRVYALPVDGPLGRRRQAHLVDFGIVRGRADDLVAVHALLHTGHARVRRDRRVAVTHRALDAVVQHVDAVVEADGLLRRGLTLVAQDAGRE